MAVSLKGTMCSWSLPGSMTGLADTGEQLLSLTLPHHDVFPYLVPSQLLLKTSSQNKSWLFALWSSQHWRAMQYGHCSKCHLHVSSSKAQLFPFFLKTSNKAGVVVHNFNPSTWDAEAGGSL